MVWLLLVSFVWAFSFGLIKGRLAGLDPVAISVIRLALASLVFLPFLRPRRLSLTPTLGFAAIGAVQFGMMYVLYLKAFAHLQAYEVALFTIFTPFYVALLDAAIERRLVRRHLVAAAIAVAGAGVMIWEGAVPAGVAMGFMLMQGSNVCFAAGQIAYRRWRHRAPDVSDAALFGWLYLGALATTALLSVGTTSWSEFRPNQEQWLTLIYLGVLASGLGFFGWNLGALRVNAGTLAVFNNLKIPLAVACSLLFFGETADLPRLIVSLALMAAAVWVAEKKG